jgi:hypothetical protein
MPLRTSMASLIGRVRDMINDTSGASQVWSDFQIQMVLDESRQDIYNLPLEAKPTYSGTTLSYFDYFAPPSLGDWEDDIVLKQYLTTVVTPSVVDDIVGHYTFAASTYPPVFATGKTFDIYRSAADLLERWAAKWVLSYDATVDGQSLHRHQAQKALQDLAKNYRLKQRAHVISTYRGDIASSGKTKSSNPLGPQDIDYYASG